jgi:hypothetical protein
MHLSVIFANVPSKPVKIASRQKLTICWDAMHVYSKLRRQPHDLTIVVGFAIAIATGTFRDLNTTAGITCFLYFVVLVSRFG